MADKTAAEKLQDFMNSGPQPDQFMRSRVIGKGKNSQVTKELDQQGYTAARQRFLSDNADIITSLKGAVEIENSNAAIGTQQSALDLNRQQVNQNYLNSPTHALYQQYGTEPAALVPGVAGTLFNRFVGTPKPGASIPRILAPYVAEGLATGGLGYFAKQRAESEEKTNPQDADVSRLWGNVGEGWGAGSVLGGIFKAAKGAPPANALTVAPTPEAIEEALKPQISAPLSPSAEKARNIAKVLGSTSDLSHEDALAYVEGKFAKNQVSPAQKTGIREILSEEMTSPQHTFKNAFKKIAPGLGPITMGALFGADAANNEAHAAGLEGAPAYGARGAGAVAGGAAGYGAYRGVNALLHAISEASPTAARVISYGGRALPVAGEGLMGYGALSGMQSGLERAMAPQSEEERQAEAGRRELGERLWAEQQRQAERDRMARSAQGAAWRDPEMRQAMMAGGVSPNALGSYGLVAEGNPVQNELAMTGPDARFYQALREFQEHFKQPQPGVR
jgi:hypothetical protein